VTVGSVHRHLTDLATDPERARTSVSA
jgi:hypothetical protein